MEGKKGKGDNNLMLLPTSPIALKIDLRVFLATQFAIILLFMCRKIRKNLSTLVEL